MGGARTTRKAEKRQQVERTWFYFYSANHARAYLWTCLVAQLLGPIGLIIGITLPGNWPVAIFMLTVGIVVNGFYLKTWIHLCRQAYPRVPRIHWFTSGLINPMTLRALRQATVHLRDQ